MADIEQESVNIYEVPEGEEVVVVDEVMAVGEEVVVVAEETIRVAEPTSRIIPPNRPRKIYAGMWGPAEIGSVAAGALTVLMALVAYFFWVVPSSQELVKNRAEADRLEAELASAKTKYGEITSTETQVAKIVTSIDDFEARFLPVTSTGQAALYQRLNGLIAAYGLVNTTGPDYSPLEAADQNVTQQSDDQKGRSKYRSLYPGVYVSTTLEGSYHNLRRFIREIETGREFIVVSAVELVPSDTKSEKDKSNSNAAQESSPVAVNPVAPQFGQDPRGFPVGSRTLPAQNQTQSQPKRQEGKTHGGTVSLHIEMAAYFRRPRVASVNIAQ